MNFAVKKRRKPKGKHSCRVCARREKGKCQSCRDKNAVAMTLSRIRRGEIPMRECWRCMKVHPCPVDQHGYVNSETYCHLAPEWNGWPWGRDSDSRWVYPEWG